MMALRTEQRSPDERDTWGERTGCGGRQRRGKNLGFGVGGSVVTSFIKVLGEKFRSSSLLGLIMFGVLVELSGRQQETGPRRSQLEVTWSQSPAGEAPLPRGTAQKPPS